MRGNMAMAHGNHNLEDVLLCIDNSNMFESAKQYSAEQKGYKLADVAIRINYRDLVSKAVGNRNLIHAKFYSSNSSSKSSDGYETLWKAIEDKAQVQMNIFQRSKWTKKEKKVDTSLTADAVEDILLHKHDTKKLGTVILFSGDSDMVPVLQKATNHGFHVEVWCFEHSANDEIKRRAIENKDPIKIIYLKDDDFKNVTFTEYQWREESVFPKQTTLVVTTSIKKQVIKDAFLRPFVEKASTIFKMPMNGIHYKIKREENLQHILLIPCHTERYSPQQCNKCSQQRGPAHNFDFDCDVKPRIPALEEIFKHVSCSIVTWDVFHGTSNSLSAPMPQDAHNRFSCLDEEFDNVEKPEEEDGFTTLEYRKPKIELCPYKYWCRDDSIQHTEKHTERQKIYFLIQRDAERRKLICSNTEMLK